MARQRKAEATVDSGPQPIAEAVNHEQATGGQADRLEFPPKEHATGHIANPSTVSREPGDDTETERKNGHAAVVGRKKYEQPKDPFDFENMKAGENRVQL